MKFKIETFFDPTVPDDGTTYKLSENRGMFYHHVMTTLYLDEIFKYIKNNGKIENHSN